MTPGALLLCARPLAALCTASIPACACRCLAPRCATGRASLNPPNPGCACRNKNPMGPGAARLVHGGQVAVRQRHQNPGHVLAATETL